MLQSNFGMLTWLLLQAEHGLVRFSAAGPASKAAHILVFGPGGFEARLFFATMIRSGAKPVYYQKKHFPTLQVRAQLHVPGLC